MRRKRQRRTVPEGTRIFARRAHRPESVYTGAWSASASRKAGDRVAFSVFDTDYKPDRIEAPREARAHINSRGEYVLLKGRKRRRFI